MSRAQNQQVTRARLLDAAETLFGERGIHQSSLDDIAASAGLTKGAIYANFGSKKQLIAAILQRRLDDDDEPQPASRSLADWIGELGDLYESSIDRPENHRFALALVELWLYGMREESTRDMMRQWFRSVRRTTAKEMAALAGDDPPASADRLAALVLAVDIGVGIQHLLDPEAVPSEIYTTALTTILGRDTSHRTAGQSPPSRDRER